MLIRGPRHVRARGLGDRPEGESAPRITGETPLPALLDDLLDAVSVGIVVQRPGGEPLWVNTAARALLGPDPVEALSSAAAGAMRRGRLQQTVLDLGPHQRPEGAHRGADDEPSEVLVTTVPIAPYGGPVAALVSTVSAEADRPADADGDQPGAADSGRLQRALLRAEQHMLALTEHSTTGLAALALDGRILHVNPALATFLGRTPSELGGTFLGDLDGPDGTPEKVLLERLAAGEGERFDLERRYQRPSGETVWAAVTLVAVPDDSGRAGHALMQVTDLTETRLALEMLQHQALHDPLTGLPNRTLGLDRITRALERARRAGGRVAVLCLDLDRFGVVNDSVGPDLGDVVLVEVASRLQLALRGGDTAARLAGDEFAVVCDDVHDEGEAVLVAERVLETLREPVSLEGRRSFRRRPSGSRYRGRGRPPAPAPRMPCCATPARHCTGRRQRPGRLGPRRRRAAPARRGPPGHRGRAAHRARPRPVATAHAADRRPHHGRRRRPGGTAALAAPRARVVATGVVPADRRGERADRGRRSLGFEEAARIAAATPGLGYVAVNVSPSQVRRANLLGDVEDSLKNSGLHLSELVIELTESVMLGSAPAGRRQLAPARAPRRPAHGRRLRHRLLGPVPPAGPAGVRHQGRPDLHRRPGRDRQCDRIVEALTGLARGLGVDIVAEGVETTEQRDVLAALGCAHAQGYLFGRPEPVEDFLEGPRPCYRPIHHGQLHDSEGRRVRGPARRRAGEPRPSSARHQEQREHRPATPRVGTSARSPCRLPAASRLPRPAPTTPPRPRRRPRRPSAGSRWEGPGGRPLWTTP